MEPVARGPAWPAIDPEVQRLARLAVDGQYLELVPLMARLHELKDRRLQLLDDTIGKIVLMNMPGGGYFLPEKQTRRNLKTYRRWCLEIQTDIYRMFWKELAEGGMESALRHMARTAEEHAASLAERAMDGADDPWKEDWEEEGQG